MLDAGEQLPDAAAASAAAEILDDMQGCIVMEANGEAKRTNVAVPTGTVELKPVKKEPGAPISDVDESEAAKALSTKPDSVLKALHSKIVALKKVAEETANAKFCGQLNEAVNKLLVSSAKIYKSCETINTTSCKDPAIMIAVAPKIDGFYAEDTRLT
jgi:hypothetical protein